MINTDSVYYLVGFLILANGATIITVLGTAFKIAEQFGSLKANVSTNTSRIEKLEEFVHG